MEAQAIEQQVKDYIDERWKIQPNGFIVSTRKVYEALHADNQRDYIKIAEALEGLGGEFFGKCSNRGLRVDTKRKHTGASKWKFTL